MAIRVLFIHADNNAFDAVSNELRLAGISPDLAVTGKRLKTFCNSMTLTWSF
jgi:hypothetical protein